MIVIKSYVFALLIGSISLVGGFICGSVKEKNKKLDENESKEIMEKLYQKYYKRES